jgi:hypothetical protein
MDKTQTPNQNASNATIDKSALEKFKLFFEHTDDSRVVVNAKAKPVKQPTRNVATKR